MEHAERGCLAGRAGRVGFARSPRQDIEGDGRGAGDRELTAARGAYLVPTTGQRIKPGEKLAKAYFEAKLPTVRWRLYRGGIRLAMVLNEAFAEK